MKRGKKNRFSNLETGLPPPEVALGAAEPGAWNRDANHYLRKGLGQELDGQHEAALNTYSSALGEDPLCVEAWTRQLWMLLMLNELDEARVWAEKAVETFPRDPDILGVQSLVLWRLGERAEAARLNDYALGLGRNSADLWLARGEMQLWSDIRAALSCLKQAAAAPGPRGLAALRAGDILMRRRRHADAAEFFREATQALPDASWAWWGYGRAERALGREKTAATAFSRASALMPQDGRYRAELRRQAGLWTRFKGFFR